MGKAKTKKAAAKRFKVTATGRVLRKSTRLNHLLGKMSRRHKRRLGRPSEVTAKQRKNLKRMMPTDF